MGTKRPIDELDNNTLRPRRTEAKRTKLSPSFIADGDSSAPASCSVSDESVLQSSPSASEHTRKTSLSSIDSSISNVESDGSPSEPESGPESESESDEEIVTIGGPKKPQMAHSRIVEGARDLKSRLDALLPQLEASNQLLASSDVPVSMEDVEEGEQHIEMNLGLGVLEDKNADGSTDTSESSGESDSDVCANVEDEPASSDAVKQARESRPSNVMEKLLGQRKGQQKPTIENIE